MEQSLIEFINAELLAEHDDADIDADTELLVEGWLDSLGVMRLVAFVGDRFGIRVPAEDITIENFRSITVIAGYLAARGAQAGAA